MMGYLTIPVHGPKRKKLKKEKAKPFKINAAMKPRLVGKNIGHKREINRRNNIPEKAKPGKLRLHAGNGILDQGRKTDKSNSRINRAKSPVLSTGVIKILSCCFYWVHIVLCSFALNTFFHTCLC